MPQKDMQLIAKEIGEKSPGFILDRPGVAFAGNGDISYRCGSCKTFLVKNVSRQQVQGLNNAVIKCGKCGNYNAIPRGHQTH